MHSPRLIFEAIVTGHFMLISGFVTSSPPGGHYLFLIWPIRGCAAGQGMVFYLSVLNRVYNFVRVCPNVRPMFSTERALLEATNEWLWNIENNLLNGVIFLDLKKALTPWIMLSYWEKLYGGQFSIS